MEALVFKRPPPEAKPEPVHCVAEQVGKQSWTARESKVCKQLYDRWFMSPSPSDATSLVISHFSTMKGFPAHPTRIERNSPGSFRYIMKPAKEPALTELKI